MLHRKEKWRVIYFCKMLVRVSDFGRARLTVRSGTAYTFDIYLVQLRLYLYSHPPLLFLSSISVLQWLCNADKAINRPKARIQRFFSTLYASLRKGARAIFQFYPENDDQIQLIIDVATRCGFEGGLLVDYPNSKKAKKYYLCLFAGQQTGVRNQMPKALGEDGELHPDEAKSIEYGKRRAVIKKNKSQRKSVKDKEWINHKKKVYRDRGDKPVARDSKFTGRKRKVRF